jgi:hypothetical protein
MICVWARELLIHEESVGVSSNANMEEKWETTFCRSLIASNATVFVDAVRPVRR